ncbi:hypothetical protein [Streptomyces agglomeratus]|nr:hypothetical protein [Streptomyces agglomeratus]
MTAEPCLSVDHRDEAEKQRNNAYTARKYVRRARHPARPPQPVPRTS